MPTEAAMPDLRAKTLKQLGTPTDDSTELAARSLCSPEQLAAAIVRERERREAAGFTDAVQCQSIRQRSTQLWWARRWRSAGATISAQWTTVSSGRSDRQEKQNATVCTQTSHDRPRLYSSTETSQYSAVTLRRSVIWLQSRHMAQIQMAHIGRCISSAHVMQHGLGASTSWRLTRGQGLCGNAWVGHEKP